MKKLMCVFFALAALLMLAVPGFAAEYDLLDGPEPAAASTSPAPNASAEETPVPVVDVPVDESAYREETPSPYEPPQRIPGQGKIADILQYWEDNGYPEHVSYAYEVGGELADDGAVYSYWEIGLVDASEAQKQEILNLVHPACLVEFKTCLFTHAQKQAAYDAITELAVTDENILEVIFIRNGDTVWVSVPEELTKQYAQYLIRDLGLGAVVSVTDQHSIATFENAMEIGVSTPGGITIGGEAAALPGMGYDSAAGIQSIPPAILEGTAPRARTSPMLWVCLGLALFAACALTVQALRRRAVPAAVTHRGTVHTGRAPLTRRETEQAVRETDTAPDARLYRAVMERLGEDEG